VPSPHGPETPGPRPGEPARAHFVEHPAPGAPAIERVEVSAYRVPTDAPEADGTIERDHTTLVLVELSAAGERGLGFTYSTEATARLIREMLADLARGRSALEPTRLRSALDRAVRNAGRPGIASHAISAVDVAAWDLKARLLGLPLATLLGKVRDEVPLYGSGGFTSYSREQLEEQLGGWAHDGFTAVKMKIGSRPQDDPERVRVARDAVGPDVELFVDANGAYLPREAIALAHRFADEGVTWFEEPVTSDDLDGMRFVRERLPGGMRLAAGEYAYRSYDFLGFARSGAVDVLQADATRCGGITGFLEAAALCEAWHLPLSAHTAPSIHLHPCCAAACALERSEYFHDHARIERMFFEGAAVARGGCVRPDESRPGIGLEPKRRVMERFRTT